MWMMLRSGPNDVLAFGYEDATGSWAKGDLVSGALPSVAASAAQAPTMTLRIEGLPSRPLAPAEIAQLGLPPVPAWLSSIPGARLMGSSTPYGAPPPPVAPVAYAPAATRATPAPKGPHPIFWIFAMFALVPFVVGIANADNVGGQLDGVAILAAVIFVSTFVVAWPVVRWLVRSLPVALAATAGVALFALLACAYPMASSYIEARDRWARESRDMDLARLCSSHPMPVAGTPVPGTARMATPLGSTTEYWQLTSTGPSSAAALAAATASDAMPELVVCSGTDSIDVESASYTYGSGYPVTLHRRQERVTVRVLRTIDAALVGSTTLLGGVPGPFPYSTTSDVYGTPVDRTQVDVAIAQLVGRPL